MSHITIRRSGKTLRVQIGVMRPAEHGTEVSAYKSIRGEYRIECTYPSEAFNRPDTLLRHNHEMRIAVGYMYRLQRFSQVMNRIIANKQENSTMGTFEQDYDDYLEAMRRTREYGWRGNRTRQEMDRFFVECLEAIRSEREEQEQTDEQS